MAKGECNCGAVAFEVTCPLRDVYVCHCSICRRATGSGGIAVVVVANDDFTWTRGNEHLQTWHKPGHDWLTCFCRQCGSPLPGANDDTHTFIPVGLLSSGAENLKVAHHLFVDSKPAWTKIADDGKQHREGLGS